MSQDAKSATIDTVHDVDALDVANLPIPTQAERRRIERRFWPKFWRTVGRVPFSEELAGAWYCAMDARTPTRVKGVLFAALGYFVVPVDLVPDFIAALGFTDDATVLATAIGVVGAHVKEGHVLAARALLQRPDPHHAPDPHA